MTPNKLDPIGYLLITIFLALLSYAGYLSYKSIDWTVLQRLESQKLVLPTPIPSATTIISPTATTTAVPKK